MNNEKIKFGTYVIEISNHEKYTRLLVTKNNLVIYDVSSKDEVRMYWKFVHACELAKQIKDKPILKLLPLIDGLN